MIRLSENKDREGIIALWQEAFGDSREAVEIFLDKRSLPQNTLVAEENGKTASMLFLLDGKIKVADKILKAYYLYAAATLKEFRGKGIMAQMLKEAGKLAQDRGVDLICLKPAEKSLYEFYKNHGYNTVFATKFASLKIKSSALPGCAENCADVFSARETAFTSSDRFIWDKDAIEYAINQHKYYGGKVFENCEGYCLYSVDDTACSVKEISFTSQNALKVLSQIASAEQIDEFRIELPVDYPIDAECAYIDDNGMALLISDESQFLKNRNDLYLNLTLD